MERKDEQRDLEVLDKMTYSLVDKRWETVSTRIRTDGTRSIREMTHILRVKTREDTSEDLSAYIRQGRVPPVEKNMGRRH
jgi:hypothetical protein